MTSVADTVAAVKSQALSRQRLEEGDPDAERIGRCAQVIVDLIVGRLGRGDDPYPLTQDWPSPVIEAAETATIELYRRKDVKFGVIGFDGTDGDVTRVGNDVLAGVHGLLKPYRQGWFFA